MPRGGSTVPRGGTTVACRGDTVPRGGGETLTRGEGTLTSGGKLVREGESNIARGHAVARGCDLKYAVYVDTCRYLRARGSQGLDTRSSCLKYHHLLSMAECWVSVETCVRDTDKQHTFG